ncbi:MAG TPA: NAD(P)H-hydrate dehydratase [Candidatus Binatia bacterium]|nr:NAD(P)H-hydrate dehydratase [Candidatus Binatia bacterium]
MSRLYVGVDVTSIERIAGVLTRHPRFAERIFTERERRRSGARAERLATRWAAKEAVKKLYGEAGLRIPGYRAIEVVNRPGGAPLVRVDGRETGIAVSLTHDAGVAIAVAVSPSPAPGETPPAAGGAVPAPAPGWAGELTAILRPPAPILPPPAQLHLPARPPEAHKGSFGTVVVIAGAVGTAGAAVLAARGAGRAGAGLVRVCVPAGLYPVVAAQCLEVMVHPLGRPDAVHLDAAGVADLLERHLPVADALVLGPGLGRAPATEAALLDLLPRLRVPAVVDADALNIAAAHRFDWRLCPAPLVLTPHPAEMGRLAGVPTQAVQSDRRGLAAHFAAERGVTLVLKGAETVITAPDGRLHVDAHRTVALATGGTGDVLSGVCGAMLAAGLDGFEAAVAAVTIHAEAGCLVEARLGRAGSLAGDVAEMLPLAQEGLRRALELRVDASAGSPAGR